VERSGLGSAVVRGYTEENLVGVFGVFGCLDVDVPVTVIPVVGCK
jgi:hypothetical protein